MVRRCLFLGPSSTVSSDRAWKFLAAKVGRFGVEEKPPYLAPRKHKIEGESCPSCHWLPRQNVYRPTARALNLFHGAFEGKVRRDQRQRSGFARLGFALRHVFHLAQKIVLRLAGQGGKETECASRVFVADREWVLKCVRASYRRNRPGWFRWLRCSII
jgi:hypothetical protein